MDNDAFVTGELFARGFSGWAHALRRLCEMGMKIDHRFAVEIDSECVEAYSRSHNFKYRCGPSAFKWDDDELPSHLLVNADVRDGGWFHLTGTYLVDLMMMSPPCPAWSLATTAPGLMKEEGRLTIDAISLCNLVRPKVILLENVSSMRNHEHWRFIRQTLEWAGYHIRFARSCNLCEIATQNRDPLC